MALGFEDITQWSTIAANNDDADSAINWLEHQARASVNNSARSMTAAIAKDRDLKNGSIVTVGTANAQTITTPVNFGGTIPTGLRLCVKVGPGLTNTSALTLSVDGSSAAGVLNMRGQSPVPGEWAAGAFVDLIFDGTYFNMLTSLPGVFTPANINNGQFRSSSATNCVFVPFNGSQIRVNGQIFQIPSTGVNFPNTNVNVNSTLGANLGPNTSYMVGIYSSGGVLTPYYSNSPFTHSTSATIGNVGTEIVAGSDLVTLVGMIRTNASAQFVNSPTQRFVRTWFNRTPVNLLNQLSASTLVANAPWVEVSGRCEFIIWAGEIADVSNIARGFSGATIGANWSLAVGFDGVAAEPGQVTFQSETTFQPYHGGTVRAIRSDLSEGYHYSTFLSGVGGAGAFLDSMATQGTVG